VEAGAVRELDGRGSQKNLGVGPTTTRAREFVSACAAELGELADPSARLVEVTTAVRARGTYWQTAAELRYGARAAWRNSLRCIGRIHWKRLEVRDRRSVRRSDDIFEAIVEHIHESTNGGRIRPLITVFAPDAPGRPGPRIWNEQLIRYAGYRHADGSVTGDPATVEFTDAVRSLGWHGTGGRFDILPLVIEPPGEEPAVFELPSEVVLEVPLVHPRYRWFEELGLRWFALPAVSGMRLEAGGIEYPLAPFSGWYMNTEIGSRNLGDRDRYDLLPQIAELVELDTSSDRTLWKDRALVELNVAVLHSFEVAGVTMSDHHTESRRFVKHIELEARRGREVNADWTWIVPPMSASATPVFHRHYPTTEQSPNFHWNPPRLRAAAAAQRLSSSLENAS
jgi:nitric-oxide synthase